MSPPVTDPRVRFERKFEIGDGDDPCWLYTGTIYPNGYGNFAVRLPGPEKKWKAAYAHRFSYKAFVGPIPEGLDLDHLCRVRHCVNPDHLEPVTRQENLRRGRNANREKSHCPRGHAYTEENTYVERKANGSVGRKCITCVRHHDKMRWQRELARRVSEGGPPK